MFEDGAKTFDLRVYMNDESFDNDDNPYGKFVFHQYSNMEDYEDTKGTRKGFIDREIPLVECGSEEVAWKSGGIKYYCPDFN